MIQTFVTSFLTNQLFGRNRKWNGKSFHCSNSENTGSNRFNVPVTTNPERLNEEIKQYTDDSSHDHNDDNISNNNKYIVQEQHSFDFTIESTRLPIVVVSTADDSMKSIVIRYQRYQSILSLWKTMVDEVRILQKQNQRMIVDVDETNTNGGSFTYYSDTDIQDDDDDIDIMIGLGCMSWSGGILNASPFCLYRKKK